MMEVTADNLLFAGQTVLIYSTMVTLHADVEFVTYCSLILLMHAAAAKPNGTVTQARGTEFHLMWYWTSSCQNVTNFWVSQLNVFEFAAVKLKSFPIESICMHE